MNRIIIPTLAILLVGSVAGLAWFIARPADPRLVRAENELQKAREEIVQLKADMARQQVQAKVAATLPSAPTSASAPGGASGMQALSKSAPATAAAADANAKSGGALREMFKSPAMKAMMEQQQAMQVDRGYSRLMAFLNLDETEKEHFKKLLVEREKAQMDLGLKMLDDNLTPEQRKQVTTQLEQQKKTFDDAIKTFLNDENDWKTFQGWEDTKPERTQLDTMGRSLFDAASAPLSAQQEEQLVNLMVQVRKEPSNLPKMNDPKNFDPQNMTEEMFQKQLQQMEQKARRVEEEAAKFLTPAQLQALASMNKQMRDLSRVGWETTRIMMKGK